MRKAIGLAICFSTLVGCGDSSSPYPEINGKVVGSPSFQLPGSVYSLHHKPILGAAMKNEWFFSKDGWKPKGWSLWVASNVYSSAPVPGGDYRNLDKGFRKGLSAPERAKLETAFLSTVHNFVKDNKVDLEVNYLGYDSLPDTLVNTNDNMHGFFLTFDNDPCGKAFGHCIDNYFVSPAARLPGGSRLSIKEWLAPYLRLGNDVHSRGVKSVIDSLGGMDNDASLFYDWWPTMVFLVNPEGKTVRAWLPQTNNDASVAAVEIAIIKDIAGPYAKLKAKDVDDQSGVPFASYYGKYYLEAGIENLLSTFSSILESK